MKWIILTLSCVAALYTSSDDVIIGTPAIFEREVMQSKHVALVEFFAPWCGHCKNLAPEFKKAATKLRGLVKVVSIDCDAETNKPLCGKYEIKGFPTLKIFQSDKKKPVIDYQNKRDAAAFVENTVDKIASFVKSVDEESLATFIASTIPKVLLFTDKKSIPPLFKALSVEYESRISFGFADRGLMGQFGVVRVPGVVIVEGTAVGVYEVYDGVMKYAGLNEKFKALVTTSLPIVGGQKAVKVDKKVHELKTQADLDTRCLNIQKTCLIAFYNFFQADSPQNLPEFNAFMAMLEAKNGDDDYVVVWVNAAVGGEEVRRTVGVSDYLPGLAAVNTARGWSRVLSGDVDAKTVDEFIKGIKAGRGRAMKLPDQVVFGRTRTDELVVHQELIAMPFYELLCLSPPAKNVARQSMKSIIETGGVVRKIEFLGVNTLPYRMKRHQIIHERAAYFTIQFHSSPEAMSNLRKTLSFDENVVRASFFRIGDSLQSFTGVRDINKL